jgi:hypothetical protein
MNNDKALMTILVSSFLHQIHLAKAKLESRGIRSFIVDENLNSIIGTSFIEGYKLNVSNIDYEQARTILSLHKT